MQSIGITKKLAVVAILVVAMAFTMERKPVGPLQELVFDKMLGIWKNANGRSFEQWTKTGQGYYESRVFAVKGTDTVVREEAKVYKENEKWVFETLVRGQNNGQSVKFTSTVFTSSVVQFSNPAHDFPTDINYSISDQNTLKAFIVGPNAKGGRDTIPFSYSRVR